MITFKNERDYILARQSYAEFLDQTDGREHLTFEQFLEAIEYKEDAA